MKNIFGILLLLLCLFLLSGADEGSIMQEESRRITIVNNEFTVSGKRIWINGANTPWNKWNDFGGGYNDAWWDNHFAELRKAGINAVRVWINCNNDNGAITINNNGMVSGVSSKHFQKHRHTAGR